ncbi:hypothetical protein M8818_003369 [Zalaria obscura]|uniref:Uncharacterized protein n=1 Tax=Zalaria obscura TaxID=2024903 RepID=A0ACC3SFG9_9PEZI
MKPKPHCRPTPLYTTYIFDTCVYARAIGIGNRTDSSLFGPEVEDRAVMNCGEGSASERFGWVTSKTPSLPYSHARLRGLRQVMSRVCCFDPPRACFWTLAAVVATQRAHLFEKSFKVYIFCKTIIPTSEQASACSQNQGLLGLVYRTLNFDFSSTSHGDCCTTNLELMQRLSECLVRQSPSKTDYRLLYHDAGEGKVVK